MRQKLYNEAVNHPILCLTASIPGQPG